MTNTLLNARTAPSFTDFPVPVWKRGGLTGRQVNAVRALVLRDLKERCSVPRLAAVAGLSVAHFSRAFHRTCGMPPMKYVRHVKIEAACGLILRDAFPLSEIAVRCGFSDQPHFCRVFRAITGDPPTHWRKKHS